MTGRARTTAACAGLVLAVFAAFGRAAWNGFVLVDTPDYLTENPAVLAGLTWKGLAWAFTRFHSANWHPLTWLSHMLDVELFGTAPAAHHVVSVGIHAANACLVFLALSRMTGARAPSLLIAALFALHPLHVESVAWIAERKDLLAGTFGLLCLLAWDAWAKGGRRRAYALALGLFAAGLLAKPMLVTWPFVLLLADLWPLGRGRLGLRRLAVEKLPFLALSAASAVVTVAAQRSGEAVRTLEEIPFAARAGNALAAYAAYLGKTLLPVDLSFFVPLASGGPSSLRIAVATLVLLAVSAFAIARLRRAPWIAFGWAFYLGTLVPVIGLVQVGRQAIADRYTYLPLLGVFVAVAWTAAGFIRSRPALRGPAVGVAGTVLAALGVLTWRQVGVWRSTETLCRHAIDVEPRNVFAYDLLGLEMLAQGRVEDAYPVLSEAVRIGPGAVGPLVNLAEAEHRLGRPRDAERTLRRAIELAPRREDARRNLALALQAQGRLEEALSAIDAALALRPDVARAHLTRGQILEDLGRADEARGDYERALELDPRYLAARLTLARLLVRAEDLPAAERELRAAVADVPADPETQRGLALVLIGLGRLAEALPYAREALRLRPGWALAEGDLAWILARIEDPELGDPARAVALAEEAVHATGGGHAGVLDALAAAYAAQGRFEEAASTARRAMQVAIDARDDAFATRVARRAVAYSEGRIDRETIR